MMFLVFGSSASGKTTALDAIRGRLTSLAVHDFDEIGVPEGADTAWRHRSNELWVRRALDYQAEGTDLLLAAQTPFGELLATPSALSLDAISACLLDCDEPTRRARISARGSGWLARSAAGDADAYQAWAEWMRRHAVDPTWQPDVIRTHATDAEMRWERWADWGAGDPRWHVQVLDGSLLTVEQVSDELVAWIAAERALVRAGAHALSRWAGSAAR